MEEKIKESNFKRKMSLIVMAVGAILMIVGLCYKVPGDQLTTYESLSNHGSYSYVESYINGDAYNYIIAGSLVGGRIAGTLALKGGLIGIGALIICIGLINYCPNHEAAKKDKEEVNVPIDEGGIDLRKYDDETNKETE